MNRQDLEYIQTLNDMIEGALLHIDYIKSKAYPSAIRYDDTGASRPAPENKLEQVFCELFDEERRVNRLIDKRHDLIVSATQTIMAACPKPAERHVLYLRYYTNMKWPEIVNHMQKRHNIQERQVYRLHYIALSHFESYNI